MIDVQRCEHMKGCVDVPVLISLIKKGGRFCAKIQNGMVIVTLDSCKSECCDTISSNPRYEGYCLRCFMYLFPDKPVVKITKQKNVMYTNTLKNNFVILISLMIK